MKKLFGFSKFMLNVLIISVVFHIGARLVGLGIKLIMKAFARFSREEV